MFSRITTIFTVLFFAVFVTASAVARTPVTDCSTGSIQCCTAVRDIDDPGVQVIAALLGIVLSPLDAFVGLTCTPITIIGGGGNSCNAQIVCCTGTNYGSGLVVLGCSPININV